MIPSRHGHRPPLPLVPGLAVDVGGTPPVEDPTVDELHYWAPEAQLVVLTEDLGRVAPPQGLVRLGVVAER